MKTIRILYGVLAVILMLASVNTSTGEEKGNTICQLCGMDAAKSETEFILKRNNAADMHACCINCARRLVEKLGQEIKSMTALDYRTRKHVPAAEAFYVMGADRIPKGSMMPFVFAFGSRKDADNFKNRHGGTVLTFDEVVKRIKEQKKK